MNEERLVAWYKENLNKFQGEDRAAIEYMFKKLLEEEEPEIVNVVLFSSATH